MNKLVFIGLILIIIGIIILGYSVIPYVSTKKVQNILGEQTVSTEVKTEKYAKARILLTADIENDTDQLNELLKQNPSEQFGAILVIGDITSLGVLNNMTEVNDTLSGWNGKHYLVPGDRDIWASGIKNFNDTFGNDYELVDISGSKFLLINNADEYKGISDAQMDYIKQNIGQADFVILHNPIYFEGSPLSSLWHKGMGQYSTAVDEQRKELLKLIRNSNVKAVFSGDQHIYSESVDKEKSSLSYYIIGALNLERSFAGSTYAVLTIYDDGTYSLEPHDLTHRQ